MAHRLLYRSPMSAKKVTYIVEIWTATNVISYATDDALPDLITLTRMALATEPPGSGATIQRVIVGDGVGPVVVRRYRVGDDGIVRRVDETDA